MTVWTEPTECSLCGAKGREIRTRLVEWVDALPGMRFAHISRCDDEPTCRQRLAAQGEKWPIVEREGKP
jgi:hypothetical protein